MDSPMHENLFFGDHTTRPPLGKIVPRNVAKGEMHRMAEVFVPGHKFINIV